MGVAEEVLDRVSRLIGEGPIIRRIREIIKKMRERVGVKGSILRK